MKQIFGHPKCLTAEPFPYCPGCTHGTIHRLVAEVIDKLDIQEKAVCITSIGCSVRMWRQFNLDIVQGAHGRGLAIATGVRRSLPEKIVFSYQGDGDMFAIGTAETIHAANRGEKLTVIYINNTVYGATGGQQAPTTLVGQVTTSSPWGRKIEQSGFPIKGAELFATFPGVAYSSRVSVHDHKHILQAKKAIEKAFQVQMEGGGFAVVEVLSTCPTNWHQTPVEALKRMEDEMIPNFPLGVFKDWEGVN
ncbi:MAG: thiamine pyrophosphate-dependent enzyme [Desulfitobacteriaceae bacterium]